MSRWTGRIHFLILVSRGGIVSGISLDKFSKKQKLLITLESSAAIWNTLSISIWCQKFFPHCSGIWYWFKFVVAKGRRVDWDHLALLPATISVRLLGSSCKGRYCISSSEFSELDAGIHQCAKCRSWGMVHFHSITTRPQYLKLRKKPFTCLLGI